jgi:hypothetical protein
MYIESISNQVSLSLLKAQAVKSGLFILIIRLHGSNKIPVSTATSEISKAHSLPVRQTREQN